MNGKEKEEVSALRFLELKQACCLLYAGNCIQSFCPFRHVCEIESDPVSAVLVAESLESRLSERALID